MKGFYYPVIMVAVGILFLCTTATRSYANNLAQPLCSIVEGSGKKYEICLTKVTYNYPAASSTWTYRAKTLKGNDISHFVFGIPCGTTASAYSGTTGCGSVQYGNDPTTGVSGIKFDCGASSSGRTVSFTINGLYSIGLIDYAIKTGGSGIREFVFKGYGPSCATMPTAPNGSECENAVHYLQNYGLIALEDLNTLSDVHYNVFVGRNLIRYPGGGDFLGPDGIFSSPTERGLEVAGQVKGGANLKYSGAFTPPPTNTITQINSTQYTVNGYSYNLNTQGAQLFYDITLASRAAQMKSDLEAASTRLGQAAANNTTSGNLTFNVNTVDANGIAVFKIKASDIAQNANVQLNNNANANTIIINVTGTTVNWTQGVNVNINQNQWSRILWNFPDATSISVNSLKGIVLAPKAVFASNSANEGSIAVKTYNGHGEIHRPYFSGDFSTLCATPPPPTTRTVGIRVMLQGALVLPGCVPPPQNIMRSILQQQGVLPVANPYGLPQTYSAINNPNGVAGVITDWVHIELRSGNNPSTVLEQQAALLKPNGDVVNTNGEPLTFANSSNPVYLVVKHRNHVPISSPLISLDNGDTYDFTTAMNKAYATVGTPMAKVNHQYAMWGGDANGDGRVYNNASPSDVGAVKTRVLNDPGNTGFFGSGPVSNYIGIRGVYESFDINLDGVVFDNADPSDSDLIAAIILRHPRNTGFFGSGPVNNFTGIVPQLPFTYVATKATDDSIIASSNSMDRKAGTDFEASLPTTNQHFEADIKVYPNPNATPQATLELNSATAERVNILITNANGQTVQVQQEQLIQGFNQIRLETGNLPTGLYLIKIQGNSQAYPPVQLIRTVR
ncbi:MAG TPA: choice-of-anchor A family protein [Saprospiraceae bacterium]|nr:choice-of-anchor A family protein [Saprospiraceae bacterium]HMP25267.1 choice-of-anchor A family protein [Saprospiraceae bacterium]